MNYTLHNISHSDFFETLAQMTGSAMQLNDQEDLATEDFKKQADELILVTQDHIRNHILPDALDILDLLSTHYTHEYDFDYAFYNFEREPEIRKEIQRFGKFHQSLKELIGYLQVIDTLIDKNNHPKIESVSEKNNFVLSKLHTLFSGGYYSILLILKLNNIEFRSGEPREIAEDLRRRGYLALESQYGESSLAKISIKGASYVERKAKQNKNRKSGADLDKKLDSVIEHLNKIGFGQEIIFDEIGELKELQYTLSKKTWSQLLKGKLLDLALDKIISAETATFIYEYLTSGNLKLLKFP
ncbi:hypothetical protein ACS5PU_18440 [Pedobacter sp. GSP4]|uniref:hypothetical protein n=1 Tax=Pedobacter sp. GSP4 TaxID=3453716 RepID=UPI003EEBCC3B